MKSFSLSRALLCLAVVCGLGTLVVSCQKTSLEDPSIVSALKANATASSNCEVYSVVLATPVYDAAMNTTTFTWTVTNPNPGNGTNGTAKDLGHWVMPLCERAAQNIVSSTGAYVASDPSMACVAGPVLKFATGTSGSTPSQFSLVLGGEFSVDNNAMGYFKAGTDCCSRTFAGVSCVVEEKVCSYSQGFWFANAAHSWNGQTVTLGGYTYTQAEGQALWKAAPGGSGGSASKSFYQASAIILSIPAANIPAQVASDVAIIDAALAGLGKLSAQNLPSVPAAVTAAAGRISNFICQNHCGTTTEDPTACNGF